MRREAERNARHPELAVKSPAIRRLAGAFAAVTLGEWVLGTTVAVYAYRVGGAVAVGLVGFRFAPAALAGLWSTRLADQARQRRILFLIAGARGVVTLLAVAALAVGVPFAIVVGLVWLDAAAGSGYRPAQAALLPALARTPGELTSAAALISNVKTCGQLVGALLGAGLVAHLPIAWAVAVAPMLYAAAAALTVVQRRHAQVVAPRAGLAGLRTGIHDLRRRREAWLVVLHACLRSLMRGLWLALAVVVSLRLLSLGRSGLGILMAAAAAGALVALALMPRLVGSNRLARWMALGLGLCGIPVAAIALVHGATPAILLMVVWGYGMALSDAGAQTLLNRLIPGAEIGAVTGALESGKLLFEGAGSLIAPGLLLAFGTRGSVLVAGLAITLVGVLGWQRLGRLDARATARVDVLELLQAVPFFSRLRVDALEGVAARLQSEDHPAGTEIVREGDPDAPSWYLVAGGELEVELEGFVVGRLSRGSQFGERGLLRRAPRSATVRAVTEVQLFRLERDDFLGAVAGFDVIASPATPSKPEERLDSAAALARAPLARGLSGELLAHLLEGGAVHQLEPDTPIVTAGESDDRYCVLLSGQAEVVVDGGSRRELFPGDAFGEIAVLHRVPRTATVIVREAASVLSISGEALRTTLREQGRDAVSVLAS